MDPYLSRGFRAGSYGFNPVVVPENAGHALLLGPSSITIHDDGHMLGKPGNVDPGF
jgi:hypothetical protein